MAASTKFFLLCALLNLPLSKQSLSGGHHREHKVHNIVLYPDKHSWCKTTTIKQVINYPNCVPAEINNNVCVGACFSYSIPRTEPSDPGEVIVPYCDSCQPSTTTWHQITLKCDDNKSDAPPLLVKHVQIIHNCSCILCDERYKIGNKVTYDIIDNMDAEANDVASSIKVGSDLMLLQNLHAAQAYNSDIDDSTNSSGNTSNSSTELSASSAVSSEFATEILRSKRMQRVLNQKIIALLPDIQQLNRPADKEQLLDLLHVAEHDIVESSSVSSKSVKLLLTEIKQTLEGEGNLSERNVQRIRDLLQEIYSFKLQRAASDFDNHHASDMWDTFNDDDSSCNDDNAQQFIGNDLDNIAHQTRQDSDRQEDSENTNEDINTDEATIAADYMLPIWLHDVNNTGDNRSSNSNQQHVIENTDIVEQLAHEQQHATAEKHLRHQKEHHQLTHHHKRDHDEANAAHKRHQYHQHYHHHLHYSKMQPQDEELPPAVPPPLTTPEFLTNDGLLLHRQHQQNVQSREQLDVNAHELKPNHAGTLLSYHSHVAQSYEEPKVVADDDD